MIAALILLQTPPELVLPAFTAYVLDSRRERDESSQFLTLVDRKTRLLWGGYVSATGELNVSVQAEGASADVRYELRAEGPKVSQNFSFAASAPRVSTFTVKTPGWYRFTLSAVGNPGESLGRVRSLTLSGSASAGAKFNLKRRLNAASVHLGYPLPEGTEVEWMYNEVKAVTDPIHTFYMACGFRRGYFGMQVNGPKERRIIFSVWDSGNEKVDRSQVAKRDRVELLAKGPGVEASDFGNEGTGGHSHLTIPWDTKLRQRFLLRAQKDDDSTIYTAYYYRHDLRDWMLIASFRAPKDGGLLRGLHSFNENFWGDNGHLKRAAEFGPVWVRTAAGPWVPATTGRFTHDATGGKDRFDYDLLARGDHWLLQNGGFEGNSPKLGTLVEVKAAQKPPQIDLTHLPGN